MHSQSPANTELDRELSVLTRESRPAYLSKAYGVVTAVLRFGNHVYLCTQGRMATGRVFSVSIVYVICGTFTEFVLLWACRAALVFPAVASIHGIVLASTHVNGPFVLHPKNSKNPDQRLTNHISRRG